MKKLINSIAFLICVLLMLSLASCGKADKKIDEATAPLNEKITSLNGQIADLNSEITDLEAQLNALKGQKETLAGDKATLEKENADLEEKIDAAETKLRCESGIHFYDGESEIDYLWREDYLECGAHFTCEVCDTQASLTTENITAEEEGIFVAYFDDYVPSATLKIPVFTGAYINTDSEGYDADANTFTITEESPLVITFTGKNLLEIAPGNEHLIACLYQDVWYIMDYVVDTDLADVSLTDTSLTVTVSLAAMNTYLESGEFGGFVIFDESPTEEYVDTRIFVTVKSEETSIDPDTYTLVSNEEELREAISIGGQIKLTADIESVEGYELINDVIIDLAGYDITVTGTDQHAFWSLRNCEIKDSVGGSKIKNSISVNGGTLKISGAIVLETKIHDIIVATTLDLSEYTGGELFLFVGSNVIGVTISEGYAFYSEMGELITDENMLKGMNVYVRPLQGTDPDEPDTDGRYLIVLPEFTLPTEGKLNYDDYNIPRDEIISLFPEEIEMKYENGVFTASDIGAESAMVFDYETFTRIELTLVDGVWTGEADLNENERIVVEFYGINGEKRWQTSYLEGRIENYIQINSLNYDKSVVISLDNQDDVVVYAIGEHNNEIRYKNGEIMKIENDYFPENMDFYVYVEYNKDNSFARATVYNFKERTYYYYLPDGWSQDRSKYVAGGEASPDHESYTAEDFVTLCPSPIA